MTWLVTGAHGFLGLAILSAIFRACPDEAVIAADLSDPDPDDQACLAPWQAQIRHIRLDVTDPQAVMQAVAVHRPARVVHAAALTPSDNPGPAEATAIMRVNAGGTFAMIRACLAHPPERLVLVSSAGVYAQGAPANLRIEEATPVSPEGPYAASKLAMEEVARIYAEDLDIVTVRPGALYGPTERFRATRPRLSLIGRMAQDLYAGRICRLAAAQAGRDWTHAEDAADYIVALATKPTLGHRLFNITSGERHSNADIAGAFATHGLQVNWQDRPPLRHEADQPIHSARRLRAETGLIPRHDLASGIATLCHKN